jgi:hypothetical protein
MRGAFGQLLAVISELAREVLESLPEGSGARERAAPFERAALEALLDRCESLQAAVAAVAGLLDKTVTLLLEVRSVPQSRVPTGMTGSAKACPALEAFGDTL